MNFVLQKISKEKNIPSSSSFKLWIKTVLNAIANEQQKKIAITVRVVDDKESAELNFRYRNKNYPTDVLSFNLGEGCIGDIVICAPITIKEAQEQHKEIKAHFAHLTVHGVLHLLGYNHKKTSEAKKMEAIEILILKQLGFGNPYDSKKI